ncbi:hypothetical protein C8J57DRAFT_1356355 [Mycena rebaudengoi]|nr:hypothetical protein C8J57DRAFT_1356355 [Mycena rebaudengoi]
MFFNKSLLAAVPAAMLIGAANAFTGTATLGFAGTTSCDCSPSNGPFAVAVPSALIGTARCCSATVTATHNGKSVTAILSAVYDAGAGTQNIALSDVAFAQIQDTAGQTTLSPVTWAFD